jgi:hypothetical protein
VDIAQWCPVEGNVGVRHGSPIILVDGLRGRNGNYAPTRA